MNNYTDEIDLGDEIDEERIARETLERYSGSSIEDYQPYLLLTNFSRYVQFFAGSRNLNIHSGSMFQVVHSPKEQVSLLDFKIGSPSAALVVDLCAHLPVKAALLLGMCGGLRANYNVGDYFVPVAAIRGEGTSDFYFPPEVPSMANFLVQKMVTNVLEKENIRYYAGISHTTNKRFWEFNRNFREYLQSTRAQAIEMECATLFMGSYYYRLPLGALLLISDLPLVRKGIKTKKSSESVFTHYMAEHIEKGIAIIRAVDKALHEDVKGIFRGSRKKFEEAYKPKANLDIIEEPEG